MNNDLIWTGLLIATVAIFLIVPLLPALWELFRNTDAQPIFIDANGSEWIPREQEKWAVEVADVPENSTFYRVQAQKICFGELCHSGSLNDIAPFSNFTEIPTHCDKLHLTSAQVVQGSYVVHGDLIMEAGSHLQGNIKVYGNAILHENCQIDGSLFSMNSIEIGQSCQIKGAVSAHETLSIGQNCWIGSLSYPSSVSARRMTVAVGTCVHGIVWATDGGVVRS